MLTRESVTAGVSGRVDKGTEERLEMMWCQHGCHSGKEQEVYNAVRTAHCATETIDKLARSFVIVVNVGPNPVEDEQLELSVSPSPDDW